MPKQERRTIFTCAHVPTSIGEVVCTHVMVQPVREPGSKIITKTSEVVAIPVSAVSIADLLILVNEAAKVGLLEIAEAEGWTRLPKGTELRLASSAPPDDEEEPENPGD